MDSREQLSFDRKKEYRHPIKLNGYDCTSDYFDDRSWAGCVFLFAQSPRRYYRRYVVKYLCIDYGKRRIGIAVSDPTGTLARALLTIDRKVTPDYFGMLQSCIQEEEAAALVVGLPLDHNDMETPMCLEIKSFVRKLQSRLPEEMPLHFQDESFSSVKTNQILRQTSTRKKRAVKANIDTVAACVILQEFLNEQRGMYGALLDPDANWQS